jgi:integrase
VQERLGHSSITMTYDRYGHLFPRGDDAKELWGAENDAPFERACASAGALFSC